MTTQFPVKLTQTRDNSRCKTYMEQLYKKAKVELQHKYRKYWLIGRRSYQYQTNS